MKRGIFSTTAAVVILIAASLSSRTEATVSRDAEMAPPADARSKVLSGQRPSAPVFLGFDLGEERRYVLGPPEELYSGEEGTWSIRLREVLGDPEDGVFELSHAWQHADRTSDPPIGAITRIDSSGELRVNPYGFPVELRFETRRHLAGMGEEIYTIRYRLEDGSFFKHVAMDGDEIEHRVSIYGNDDRDMSVPRGVYAFVPSGLDCSIPYPVGMRDVGVVLAPPRTVGTSASPPVAARPTLFANNRGCSESLFFNPGLISLLLPVLWEGGTGEHEYVLLTPAGPFGMPGAQASVLVPGLSAGAGGANFDHQEAINPRTNSHLETITYLERTRVEVGARTRDAWVFTGMRALDNIYVDDDGVVLRVDLAAHFWEQLSLAGTGGGLSFEELDLRKLWVRLLYPSEY